MSTPRVTVRNAVKALLDAVVLLPGTLRGFTVESSRIEPVPDDDAAAAAPANTILVYATDRSDTPMAPYGMQYISSVGCVVKVEAYVSAASSTAIETEMDAVEQALTDAILKNQMWLNSLGSHPACQWQFMIKPGGRFRGLVSLALTCRPPTLEVV